MRDDRAQKVQDLLVRQIRRIRFQGRDCQAPDPLSVEVGDGVLKVLRACNDDQALAAFVLVCFGARIQRLEKEYREKFELADAAINATRGDAPTRAELLRWVADLGCLEAPYVCGKCVSCRARAASPDYEPCPGAGGPCADSHTCLYCSEVIGATETTPAGFPEHHRLRDTAQPTATVAEDR